MKTISLFIVLIMIMLETVSSQLTVTGRITDEFNSPLPGVSVKVKGRVTGTISDLKGNYHITLGYNDNILVFRAEGYNTHEEVVSGRSVINVKLSLQMPPEKEKRDFASYDMAKMETMAAPSVSGAGYRTKGYQGQFYERFNTEGYAPVNEGGFKDPFSSPLSTFSIDVDNASYSNIRRFINGGSLPPADAVRIEEMINYFRYDYPEPDGEHPFSVYTELATCPWNRGNVLLHVGLRGKSIEKESLPPSNIVFLIDVSGSMNSPEKLPLLKSAFSLLVNELRPVDRVAIVVYAGAAGLVLESTPGNKKELIMKALDQLEAGGSTAGGAGLRLAYNVAERNFIKGGNNRIILATDGDFNVGESSNGSMERLVEENRNLGIFMTVLGFGMGNLKDDKMEIIADKGNGNYSYIDNLQEARRVLVREFGGTLFTIAKDVKFQIEFNPAMVSSYRLIGYENRVLNSEDFNDDTKDAGEMGSGHMVTALYEIVPAAKGKTGPSVDPLKYQLNQLQPKNVADGEWLTVKVRYKDPDGAKSRLLSRVVRSEVNDIREASNGLRHAAAVTEFGMILRNSEFTGTATISDAILLAESAIGKDTDGYRAEMIRLMKTVRDMRLITEEKAGNR